MKFYKFLVLVLILVPSWSCSKAVYKPLWHTPLLNVQWINSWWWTEEISEACRFSWQNKFVKLVHLVGFIIKKDHSVYVPLCLMQSRMRHLTHSYHWSIFVKYSSLWSMYAKCLSENVWCCPVSCSIQWQKITMPLRNSKYKFRYGENRFHET
jgi:hypothetical protein